MFPRLTLSPDSRMIQSPPGHRVDQSDIGALLVNVREVQRHGDTRVVGDEIETVLMEDMRIDVPESQLRPFG